MLITGYARPQKPEAPIATPTEVAALADSIRALGQEVYPSEATLAARTTFKHARRLSAQYQVTDLPLIHNTKVNLGLRALGLCRDWAEDMQAHLKKSGFKTFDLHMARSKPEHFRIGHGILSSVQRTIFIPPVLFLTLGDIAAMFSWTRPKQTQNMSGV